MSTKYTLKLKFSNSDGDTSTMTIANPVTPASEDDINAFADAYTGASNDYDNLVSAILTQTSDTVIVGTV